MKRVSYKIVSIVLILFVCGCEETIATETSKEINETMGEIEKNMELSKKNNYSRGSKDTTAGPKDYSFHPDK
jgi:type III secretory pathway lipoprotein EscJ